MSYDPVNCSLPLTIPEGMFVIPVYEICDEPETIPEGIPVNPL